MKAKKSIYLGLAALLILGSLANIPTQVLAAGTDNSSSSSQSSSANSGTSSSQSSASSSTNADSGSNNQATKTTVVTQDDPPAPTTADGVKKADWNGSFFIIPIITGFQVQPQSEQYVVANSSGNGVADLGFKAAFVAGALEKIGLSQTIWSWNGTSWTSKTTTSNKPGNGLLDGYILNGNPTVDNTVTFPLGTYYVQYVGSFHGWLDLPTFHSDKKVSKLVKVVVVPTPVQATDISITVPRVIFANAAYEGDAVTTPVDSTGAISWTGGLLSGASWDGLTWNQQIGRNSNFMVNNDKQPTDVNRDTDTPGTPILMAANAATTANANGNVNDTKTTYLGGLVAKKMAADEGGTWSLDSAGLKDLEASVNPASGTNVTWDYQWQYSTDGTGKDSSFKDIPTNADGVSNISGTVADANELSNTSNVLTFNRDSSWINAAAVASSNNKDYVVREKLTANVPDQSSDGSGKDQTININSNAASLTVTGAVGRLSLDSVPDFDFGDVTTTDIYNGTNKKDTAKDSTLAVTDTRSGSTYWNLTSKMSRFTGNQGTQLDSNVTIWDSLNDNAYLGLTDDGSTGQLAYQYGSLNEKVNGILLMNSNHKVNLIDNEKFTSNITWNLMGQLPSSDPVE